MQRPPVTRQCTATRAARLARRTCLQVGDHLGAQAEGQEGKQVVPHAGGELGAGGLHHALHARRALLARRGRAGQGGARVGSRRRGGAGRGARSGPVLLLDAHTPTPLYHASALCLTLRRSASMPTGRFLSDWYSVWKNWP